MIRSLVSIPDVHGDLARLQSAFQLANLTDSRNAWRAPAGTVVVSPVVAFRVRPLTRAELPLLAEAVARCLQDAAADSSAAGSPQPIGANTQLPSSTVASGL